ncbi:MAG TPA: hypothetical protein VIV58_28110 [Kofleriaceae bacterium]
MLTKLLVASLVSVVAGSFAGCVPCDSEVTQHGLAPRPEYDVQIDACITKHVCLPLCSSVFQLASTVDVRSCKIDLVDAASAHVVVRYYDNSCAASGDDSASVAGDDGSYDDGGYGDDGTDDGSTDDGSTDDGSTDGGDTGDSGGDGGGDSGGDGGGDSGGDSGWRVGPHHEVVKSLTTPNPRQ